MRNVADKTVLTTYDGKLNYNLGAHRLELYGFWSQKTRDNRKREFTGHV